MQIIAGEEIIASGPHNSNKIKLNVLNGLAPPPPRAIVASFRGLRAPMLAAEPASAPSFPWMGLAGIGVVAALILWQSRRG